MIRISLEEKKDWEGIGVTKFPRDTQVEIMMVETWNPLSK